MKLKNHEWQVSDLELSKKLKELGVKQESLLHWIESFNKKQKFLCLKTKDGYYCLTTSRIFTEEFICRNAWDIYSAFTVAELGDMLPLKIKGVGEFQEYHDRNCWLVGYDKNCVKVAASAHTEANTRAKMVIFLREKKLLAKGGKE